MIKKLLPVLLLLICSFTYGQTLKTDVVVIGGEVSGTAAAIQCARSKVKTILAENGTAQLGGGTVAGGMLTISANSNIPSGIWGEFRKHVQDFYRKTPGYDTLNNAALKLEPLTGKSILKKITDTVKNLTVLSNARFTAIKKDGDRWDVTLTSDGKVMTVKARVVIDATKTGEVVLKAGAKFRDTYDSNKANGPLKLYRTSIAAGDALPNNELPGTGSTNSNYPANPSYIVPMNTVLVTGADNLLVTEKALPGNKNIQYLPLQLQVGQGVGTVAAYCAFFKTSTQKLNVRIIQGELLDFKGYLLPFADITPHDAAWRPVQQVCATGMLKGIQSTKADDPQLLFLPDSAVMTQEVQPVLTEIYTRAFLWFGKEKPGEKFTVGNMLSFISDYTLTDPQVLNASLRKEWKTRYKFKFDPELSRAITRREFAVLANKFLNPFARTVDLAGQLVN